MEPGDAPVEEFAALGGGVLDTVGGGGLVVARELLQTGEHGRGNPGPAEIGEFLDLRRGQNREDAGDDGDGTPKVLLEVTGELEVVGVVEEQLRDHVARALGDLVLEALPVDELAFAAGDVAFGKARDPDVEPTGLPDESDQFMGEFEATLDFGPFLGARGGVAAKRENVPDAAPGGVGEHGGQLVPGRVHARQVGHRREPMLPLDAVDDPKGLLAGAPSGAVGHGAIVRPDLEEGGEGLLQEVALTLIGLRWEEFERKRRPAGGEAAGVDVADELHGAASVDGEDWHFKAWRTGKRMLARPRGLFHVVWVKSQVIWATGILVMLNVAFFGVYLFRSPGVRSDPAGEVGDPSIGIISNSRPGAAPAGVYAVTGVVRELRDGGSNVMIRHETIPGYMAAMTMPFTVRDPREVASVRPGDQVTFRLLVGDDESWIDSVKRVGVVEEPPTFLVEQSRVVRDVEPLEIGQVMPDYAFTNEFGAQVRLSDYRGKVVGMTFIFTRCPLPDFCPRMLKNFTSVASQLAAAPDGLTNWHLVTMTIDPGFDTVDVLRSYAERHQYDPKRWTFLTGALIDIDAITEQVGLVFRRQTPNSLPDHNLRTLVIDPEGRLKKIIIGNTWKPAEFLADLREAARGGGE